MIATTEEREAHLDLPTGVPSLWLSQCEANGYTFDYDATLGEVVPCKALGTKVAVISDLHIGAGIQHDASYAGCENFYSDDAFARFLDHLHDSNLGAATTLIINGDFIDFLRIVDIPSSDGDFQQWKSDLDEIGYLPQMRVTELQSSIYTETKQGYGLKTNDYKSVWKLRLARIGHERVFTSLAEWVAKGNELFITKGNHDLEWYWLPVRNTLRSMLARNIAACGHMSYEAALRDVIFPRVRFFDHAIGLNGNTYIEHGHLYDKFTTPKPYGQDELIVNGESTGELNLPAGSFFNRYLINRLELRYPFMNNVRPRTSMLPMLIKTDFPLAVKVLLTYIPKLVRSMRRRYYGALFTQTLLFSLCLLVPLIVVLLQWGSEANVIVNKISNAMSGVPLAGDATIFQRMLHFVTTEIGSILGAGAGLTASYFLSRLLSFLQLEEPTSLLANATPILKSYDVVTMGHTHDPEQYEGRPGRWFFNTGTWIPIIEASTTAIREDKTYSFLKLNVNPNGHLEAQPLLRWNDDARDSEPLILVRNSDEAHSAWAKLKASKAVRRLRWGLVMP